MPEITVLENEALKVEFAADPTFQVTIADKRSGFRWECPGAPFVLHYWEATQFAVRTCAAAKQTGWEFRLLPDPEQVAVQCTWPRAACSFRVIFRLNGPTLEILVPGKRVVENRHFEVRQMALDILPGLGAARTGEDGYLLVPRELGTICRFNKTGQHESSLLFYADGERVLTAPVFGMRRGAGFLGIVAEGEFNAELVIAANGGPERNLNWVHSRLRWRLHSGDAFDEDSQHRVLYTFLAEPDADYAGMARTYRRHLREQCDQATLEDRAERWPLLAYARTATTVHVHLAEKRRTTRMSGDGELMVKTRFEEVGRIAQSLKKAGVEHAIVVLAGWNCEGRDGLYPTRFPVESAVGGADAMGRAAGEVRAAGFQAGALDNYTDMYRRSPAFNEGFGAKQLGGEPWRGGIWAGGQSYVICPAQARERYVQRDMRRLCDLGLEGLLFLDHCPGPGVLRCYDENHPLTRAEYAREIRGIIIAARATFGLCRVSEPAVFAALEADTCMVPVAETPRIDDLATEWFVDETVPFLPIALHGTLLLAGDAEAERLRLAEYGAAPVYTVTAGEVGHRLEDMASFHKRYVAEIAPLVNATIESHEATGDGLIRVTYSTGTQVLINRTAEPASVGGVEIGARDFRVKR